MQRQRQKNYPILSQAWQVVTKNYQNKLLAAEEQFIEFFQKIKDIIFKIKIQSYGGTKASKSFEMNQIVKIQNPEIEGFCCQNLDAMTALKTLICYDSTFSQTPTKFDGKQSFYPPLSNSKRYSQQLIQNYKFMVHEWSHLGQFSTQEITKQGMHTLYMIHDQKRKKILNKTTTKPTYLYIKTGKYFFEDEFISKNSIVVDNIGRNDSANIIRKPLRHTKDSFYFYCISTTFSIFTPEEQTHISNFLKLNSIQNMIFAFSFYRNLDGKQGVQLQQTIQKIYLSIFKIIPLKLLQIIQKQHKFCEDRIKENHCNALISMKQKLKQMLQELNKYQQQLFKLFPEKKYQDVLEDQDEELSFAEMKSINNKREFSSQKTKLYNLKKLYPFSLIKISSPNLNHLKHRATLETYNYKDDINLFDSIQKQSESKAKKKIKNSIFHILCQFYQQVENKAKQIIRSLQNRIQTCNKKEENVLKIKRLQTELRKYHQKLKIFLNQQEIRLNKNQCEIFDKINQNLRVKYKQYQNKQIRSSYQNKCSIKEQILKSTQKLFKDFNKQIIQNLIKTKKNFEMFLKKQLKNKQQGLLTEHLSLFLRQFFMGKLSQNLNNLLIQKYFESMSKQIMNLIKAKQQIWHKFIDNVNNFLRGQNIFIDIDFVRFSQIIVPMGLSFFALTMSMCAIIIQYIYQEKPDILSLQKAEVSIFTLLAVSVGSSIYGYAKFIENTKKIIQAKKQKDVQFFWNSWENLGIFYDKVQKLIEQNQKQIENGNIKWVTNFECQDYISQLIGVLTQAEPSFLRKKIKQLETIEKQAKRRNHNLGLSFKNGYV